MDNITHTIVGVMVGEAAHQFAPRATGGLSPPSRRIAGISLMVVGNNLPDADFLYSAITGSKLDYLLQHRGHTHTLLAAVLIGALLLAGLWLWLRWRGNRWSRVDAIYLASLALFAPLLHIGLDFTNSYGVHPFWPLDNRWYYGDAVFIIEPLLWICATPLLFTLRSTVARLLIGLVPVAGIALCLGSGMVPMAMVIVLAFLLLALAGIGRVATARTAMATGIGAWLAITAMFFVSASLAEARISALVARHFPHARTLDLVLTPMPANPFCREVFVVQTQDDQYVIRKAAHSLAPVWFPALECPARAAGTASTVALGPAASTSAIDMHWRGQIVMPRTLLPELARQYCSVRALLRFARVPWAQARGAGWIVGDMRYDREPELGFAEIETGPGQAVCPAFVPAWTFPRSDLLPAY